MEDSKNESSMANEAREISGTDGVEAGEEVGSGGGNEGAGQNATEGGFPDDKAQLLLSHYNAFRGEISTYAGRYHTATMVMMTGITFLTVALAGVYVSDQVPPDTANILTGTAALVVILLIFCS